VIKIAFAGFHGFVFIATKTPSSAIIIAAHHNYFTHGSTFSRRTERDVKTYLPPVIPVYAFINNCVRITFLQCFGNLFFGFEVYFRKQDG